MNPWLRVAPSPLGVLAAVAMGAWSGAWAVAVAFGVGLGLLAVQMLRAQRGARASREREAVARMLDEVTPLTRSGVALESALISAADGADHPGPGALAGALRATVSGQPVRRAAHIVVEWPLSHLAYRLSAIHRDYGGDPTTFLTTLRNALGLAEDLARKKELALLQIRWQANVITVLFFLVLAASLARAGPFYAALMETEEGRAMTAGAAALVVWGRVVLNRLGETME